MKQLGNGPSGLAPPVSPVMVRSDDIVHAQTRALLTYWQRLRSGRVAPHRSQIDPRDLECDIGHLFIIEALEDGTQRFRVAGSRIVDTFGMELRGLPVRSIMDGEARDRLTALVAETLAEPGIGYARLMPGAGGAELWEMLLLPLRSGSGRLDRLIGVLFQLAGGRNADRLMPLKLTLERVSIEPILPSDAARDAARQGFAEPQVDFAGLPTPTAPARLTAIEGGATSDGQAARRARPRLRVVDED